MELLSAKLLESTSGVLSYTGNDLCILVGLDSKQYQISDYAISKIEDGRELTDEVVKGVDQYIIYVESHHKFMQGLITEQLNYLAKNSPLNSDYDDVDTDDFLYDWEPEYYDLVNSNGVLEIKFTDYDYYYDDVDIWRREGFYKLMDAIGEINFKGISLGKVLLRGYY